MRPDANRIAVAAVRHVLEAAQALTLQVHGTTVVCGVRPSTAEPWPAAGVDQASEAADGPWPQPVDIECTAVALRMAPDVARNRAPGGEVSIVITLRDRGQQLVWVSLPPYFGDVEDGDTVSVPANVSIAKRKETVAMTSLSFRRIYEDVADGA